jgi:hypothetical protein
MIEEWNAAHVDEVAVGLELPHAQVITNNKHHNSAESASLLGLQRW